MSGTRLELAHLDDATLQGLADGSLRGPDGYAAHAHCDVCADCADELAGYVALSQGLSALVDPPVPLDFTARVVEEAGRREAQLEARRQHLLAAIPAAALALVAVVGWSLSAGLAQRVNEIIAGVAVFREVCDVALPVLSVARLPIAAVAFFLCAAILTVLSRTLRRAPRPSEA